MSYGSYLVSCNSPTHLQLTNEDDDEDEDEDNNNNNNTNNNNNNNNIDVTLSLTSHAEVKKPRLLVRKSR